MKRWIFTILLFLLLGAVVNVAIAWACAYRVDAIPRELIERAQSGASHRQQPRWTVLVVQRAASTFVFAESIRVSPPNPLQPGASQEDVELYREGKRRYEAGEPSASWSEPASVVVAVPYWSQAAQRPNVEEIDCVRHSEDARGWPMRSLVSRKDAKRLGPHASWASAGSTWRIDLGEAQGPLGLPRVLPLRPIALGFIINTLLYTAVTLLVFIVCLYVRRLLRLKRGRCPKCGYDLRGELQAGCPECGWGREEAPPTMRSIVLDHQDRIQLDPGHIRHYHNELQVLDAWRHGMHFLYQQVRAMEQATIAEMAEICSARDVPGSPGTECPFPNLGCCFQWYAVTLCNFVELVGCIGWEIDNTRPPPREYIRKTIPVILAYRNYVAAHPARARKGRSNAAERLGSLLPPTSQINGRYFAGAWKISTRDSGTVSDSGKIRPWSLTMAHEKLAARYWPQHGRDESQALT